MAVAALQVAGWGPRGWNRSPEGVAFSLERQLFPPLLGEEEGLRGCNCRSEPALHVST